MTTMPTTRPAKRSTARNHWVRSAAVIFCIICGICATPALAWASAQQAGHSTVNQAQTGDFPSRDEDRDRRVYDNANVLTPAQVESLENELARARRLGVEILVYTRRSHDTPEQLQAFADQLRTEWGVETAAGADDGLVYLVNIENTDSLIAESGFPEPVPSVVASLGTNTMPIRQLNQDMFQDIVDDEMNPTLQEGDFNLSILYGVRRVINYAEYSPPDPASLTSTQERLNSVSRFLAACLAQIVVIGYFVVPVIREKRLSLVPTTRSLGIYAVTIGACSVLVGIVSIAGRSPLGSLTALAALIWAGCVVPLLVGALSRRRQRPRLSHVSQHTVTDITRASQPATAIGRPHA
jgi:uncharacterized membrane protein YgcG